MTTTAAQATEYANGYAAAQAAIAILAGQFDGQTMRQFAQQNIIPIHVTDATHYEHGQSDAWGDWQAEQSRTARRAAQVRYFAGQR